jgi:hypothetical protein
MTIRSGNMGQPKAHAGDSLVGAATITRRVATYGEVFPDGSILELIGGDRAGNPRLSLWSGGSETTGAVIEYGGVAYEPGHFAGSLLRELKLPMQCQPHGTTRELLAEICKLAEHFVGLPPALASLVGRFVLCTWLLETLRVAPALILVGPDLARSNQLMTLLNCVCRHPLRMTGLTPAGLRSLPSGAGFTFLISQPIGDKLETLLDNASYRDQKILHQGGLLDLFGAQVIRMDSIPSGESFFHRSIVIPMTPGGEQLPVFDSDFQRRLAIDFQAKLRNFRRATLSVARKLRFDSSKFSFPMRMLADAMAAATPDDAELQKEVLELLREKDNEIRAGRWIELNAVAVESLRMVCRESPGGSIYVGELLKIAQEILAGRGVDTKIDPGAFGKRLKFLGFPTEPRDAKGMKIRLSEEVCRRADQLARDYCVPRADEAAPTEPAGEQRPNDVRGASGTSM